MVHTHTHTHTHVHTPPTPTHTTHPHTHIHSPPPPLLLLESALHWTLHERRAVSASPSPWLRPVRETIVLPLAVTARVMWQGCTQCTMLCLDVPLLRPGTRPTLLARCVCILRCSHSFLPRLRDLGMRPVGVGGQFWCSHSKVSICCANFVNLWPVKCTI